ncbi:Dph6-related ATP pyrophosphatase [Clostridium septicum]|uniref:ATP-binding protein n=1 Tax=Clostridium septicum TaxID=1504 RepID=A0A9N7PM07_CLOSE|nr:diphthine--ammonia ligase [Clostridium septicum]AYE35266.1 ATP-binding protein [Clostridium septicum]MDU1313890.1 diphthine--ammonia ligase [Clostridium septicum]QAS60661.1 diphthine--ammonia ligase [Clostridium septicum]UEC20084.1 diphthine--ammonia ligase [Clostridium septicum]USS01860.1 diphthine--ammonia ligase [Clostridium septicum]
MKRKFIMSYSCGKDSTLALHRMIKSGNIPLGLLVTVDKKHSRSWFHGVPKKVLKEVSKSLNIPLLLVECEGEEYEYSFEKILKEAKNNLGADSCVFGDIDLEEHRTWCTDRCNKVSMEAIFPLWNEGREKLTYEFIESGYKAVIKNVKLEFLSTYFLGKVLNKDIVNEIKATGADVCGENGEYHTFVYDGPLFNFRIKFNTNGNILNNTHGFLDIGDD